MNKSYSKSELEPKAAKVFKDFPTAKKAFATSDGQFFLEANRANIHATSEGKVFTFENENVQSPEPKNNVVKGSLPKGNKPASKDDNKSSDDKAAKALKMKTAREAAAALVVTIATLTTVDEVKAAIKGVTAKSVLKASAARINEIEAAPKGDAKE